MTRAVWTDEMKALLTGMAADGLTAGECADALGLTEGQVRYQADKLEIGFDSTAATALRNFLNDGGRLIREDFGGVVGVRWACAHRCGGSFPTAICERLLSLKRLAPEPGSQAVYYRPMRVAA